jgi:hypothetical protein
LTKKILSYIDGKSRDLSKSLPPILVIQYYSYYLFQPTTQNSTRLGSAEIPR